MLFFNLINFSKFSFFFFCLVVKRLVFIKTGCKGTHFFESTNNFETFFMAFFVTFL